MGKLFGTDGIRGKANIAPMTSETALAIGRATAEYFCKSKVVVVGKDTRLSGDMITYAAISGICSAGTVCYYAGILPTPGIAAISKHVGADAGIMISASHNPYYDNGIKIFQGDGFKLSDSQESEIEKNALANIASNRAEEIGYVKVVDDAAPYYVHFLKTRMPENFSLKGIRIVADCSHGATSYIVPTLFSDLGADIEVFYRDPDGKNINHRCGSEHPEVIREKVLEHRADIGLAFDGDGDRLIAVDEKGRTITGDRMLAILAQNMKQKGILSNNIAVTTVMSNKGLSVALKSMGIKHLVADVGDRYVMELMLQSGAVLGGEDSGHMIFLNSHTTGDGLLTALKLIECMKNQERPLSELGDIVTVFPQILMNTEVSKKPPIESVEEIMKEIRAVEDRLGENGRVLVRYSGTQPFCRVMVEGPDRNEIQQYCLTILNAVKKTIGI